MDIDNAQGNRPGAAMFAVNYLDRAVDIKKSFRMNKIKRSIYLFILLIGLLIGGILISTDSRAEPGSLKDVPVPLPTNLGAFVKDKNAAIQLGKVLFWDVQVGSNGSQACASCHYSAGVDNRSNNNTVHPGTNGFVNTALPLDASDFPFGRDNDDVIGSQGLPAGDFLGLIHGDHMDACSSSFQNDDPLQKTGRQAPSVIMAVYNSENFWDGRAKRVFNGVNPSGSGTNAKIWVKGSSGLVQQQVSIQPASTASQATGPALNSVEMSCAGRTFRDLGRKLINNDINPLAQQFVATDDSTLGGLSNFPVKGLRTTYRALIKSAFLPKYTSDDFLPDSSDFTQIEANFSLFWGLSILMYESTLIPDDSRFDQFKEGAATLTAQEKKGLNIFNDKGRCEKCHAGSTFTAAAIVEEGDSRAFTNIGVRPTAEDRGQKPDNKGKFKTPTVRNAELTGPYFRTGGYLTLRQVVDFYNRGGDFDNDDKDSQVRPLGLSTAEKNALVAFLLTLTDERVRCERAPFDHPSIDIPNGPSIKQVGASGRAASDCLKPFLNADPFMP